MARAWAEHPRVVVAQVVGLIALVVACIFIGMALKSDPAPRTPAGVQARLDRAERQVRRNDAATKTSGAALKKARKSAATRARRIRADRRRLRAAAVRERRLRAALRRARR